MKDRDKFLTEAVMGGTRVTPPDHWICDAEYAIQDSDGDIACPFCSGICFSDWEGFGKLWEWAQDQEWFFRFWMGRMWSYPGIQDSINPDNFATAIHEYLTP